MITKSNFKSVLRVLNFEENGNIWTKDFPEIDAYLKIDFDSETLIYPEDKGLTINERQTCNFSQDENFVVFECVHRLFEKGYKPSHIELEPKWKVGRGASGGRADILIKNQENKPLLLIECKTTGREFDKAWRETQDDGGQLFSYAQQISQTEFLCLYASDLDDRDHQIIISQKIISHKDNEQILAQIQEDDAKKLKSFKEASNVKQRYEVWKNTYLLEFTEIGIFEDNILAYQIGKDKYTLEHDTKPITAADKKGKYHEFRTILRKHNIARKETAFEVLVNLFLCKIVDEEEHPNDLKFYWKGIAYDNYFDFVDRLQELYKTGMGKFLNEEITYISNEQIEQAFWTVKNKRNSTRKTIQKYFRELKFFSNSAFSFINIHNEKLFKRNAKVLVEIIGMWQKLRLKTENQNQFLGDMFEYFLDNSIKQSEGQFFTPLPICKFIVSSLPLEYKIQHSNEPLRAIDYACGSGHFLNEYAHQIKPLVEQYKTVEPSEYYKNIVGIEKEDRLAKVAKVSAYMYGQKEIKILDKDALDNIKDDAFKLESFDVLVANPPFAVEGFLRTLDENIQKNYTLTEITDINSNTNNIQCFFIERAKQVIAPGGVLGIIVPSSILSNSDKTYIRTREIILQYFDIVSIVELGNGTFGKTGTNTVVLFLRRKQQKPEPANHYHNRVADFFEGIKAEDKELEAYEDLYLIRKYCEHIEVDYSAYLKLLNIRQEARTNGFENILDHLEDLLAFEIFQEYQADFNKSTKPKITKKYTSILRGLPKKIITEFKKQFKKEGLSKTATELAQLLKTTLPARRREILIAQKIEINKKFIAHLRTIEKDKLYYFILAYENPQKVFIVKSPTKNAEQKKFLGYEWSGSKGSEGIKYYGGEVIHDIITPMFDPQNPNNPDKINYYIQQNFLGNTFSALPEGCTYANVQDMLDFSRKDFNKSFSLSAKRKIVIDTKWDLVKLGEIADIQSGGTPSSTVNEYWNGDINWATLVDTKNKYLYSTKRKITQAGLDNSSAKLLPINTVIFSSRATIGEVTIAKAITATNQGYKNFICDEKKIKFQYLYEILKRHASDISELASGMTYKEISKTDLVNFKIPLPPLNIQQKIVTECEVVDDAVLDVQTQIIEVQEKIKKKIKHIYNTASDFMEIRKISTNIQYGLNEKMNTIDKGYKTFRMNEIINGKMHDGGKMKYADISATEFEKYKLNKGDILFNRTNSIEHVGKTGIFNLDGDYCFASYLVRVVVNEEIALPSFVNLMMNSESFQNEGKSKASKAINQANINATIMGNIKIPIISLKDQQVLVTEIEALENRITAANEIITTAPVRKEAIIKSYL